MESVKYFTSGMSGAPSLANVAGNLISVLDACLVDGFGAQIASAITIAGGVGVATLPVQMNVATGMVVLFTGATGSYLALNGERKITLASVSPQIVFDATGLPDGNVTGSVTVKYAAAGWVKAFSGTNLAAYKSGNVQASGTYLAVTDTGTTVATVRGYENMTGISAASGQFPTAAQAAVSVWPKSNNAVAKNWFIVASDNFFYFGMAFNASYIGSFNIYGFGDTIPRRSGDPYRAVLLSLNTDPTSSAPSSAYCPVGTTPVGNTLRYSPRSYSGLGNPVVLTPTWLDASVSGGYSGFGGRVFPNPADNGIIFSPILMLDGSGFRGELPGCFATPQNIQGAIVDGTLIQSVPNFNRQMLYRVWMQSSSPAYGGVFFDLTGPWGN